MRVSRSNNQERGRLPESQTRCQEGERERVRETERGRERERETKRESARERDNTLEQTEGEVDATRWMQRVGGRASDK